MILLFILIISFKIDAAPQWLMNMAKELKIPPKALIELVSKTSSGEKVLDMTYPVWVAMPTDKQILYAQAYQKAYAMQCQLPIEKKFYYEQILFEMVLVPPGKYWMGISKRKNASTKRQKIMMNRQKIMMSKPFWIGKYEVTVEQWEKIMNKPSSFFYSKTGKTPKKPVTISWNECQSFCEKTGLRLPTEKEWEYACRAGTTSQINIDGKIYYDRINCGDENGLNKYGKEVVLGNGIVDVGSLPNNNAWGCYDFHGNVNEYCADHYKIKGEEFLVYRGGGWHENIDECSSTARIYISPNLEGVSVGFRVILEITR